MECQSGVPRGAAPASVAAADISALLPESVGQGSLVTEDLRGVSPLARRVMLPRVGATRIPAITTGPSLAPESCTRCVVRWSCDDPSERDAFGTQRAYHVPQVQSSWGGRWCLFAGGASSACAEFGAAQPGHVPFWSKPVSLLGLFWGDGVYRHFTLHSPCPRSWSPTAMMLAVVASARAFTTLPVGRRLRCPRSFRPLRYQRRRSR